MEVNSGDGNMRLMLRREYVELDGAQTRACRG